MVFPNFRLASGPLQPSGLETQPGSPETAARCRPIGLFAGAL
jgi:hypothetical protein